MAVKIEIVIPSMSRAERVITTKCIQHAKICVPESQYKEYKKYNPNNEIIAHPDSIKGITLKRQWIYEQFPNCFQIDDDIKSIQRLYTDKGEPYKLQAEEAYDIVQYIGNCAKMAGCYLFGISKEQNPLAYNDLKPLKLSGVLMAAGLGMLEGSNLYFHKDASVSEDYWISGLNAYLHRMCWIDTRFSFEAAKTFGNKGGCANFRTKDLERENTLFLRRMFGDAIKLKRSTKLSKVKHEFMRTLEIPF